MPSGTLLLAFVAASLVVLVTPGPGVLYVVARSVGQGYRAGLASVLGLSAGALVHVAAATLGLSAVLLTSAYAGFLQISDPKLPGIGARSERAAFIERLFRDARIVPGLDRVADR